MRERYGSPGHYTSIMQAYFDTVWHRWLKRPYRAAIVQDTGGDGSPVVLLHGLGASGEGWRHLAERLQDFSYRLIILDLIGFGKARKPVWIDYTVDDHANAVISTLKRSRLSQPAILVGHSMGCLVAVRVARLAPNLVRHLVLYEMPLYAGLPDKRRYRLRLQVYFALYKRIIQYQPIFEPLNARRAQRLVQRISGMRITPETWQPFIRSLEHTIMQQTAADDIKQLRIPMDVIYGSRDRLVIRGKTKAIFGTDAGRLSTYTIREKHRITVPASRFLAERIAAAVAS